MQQHKGPWVIRFRVWCFNVECSTLNIDTISRLNRWRQLCVHYALVPTPKAYTTGNPDSQLGDYWETSLAHSFHKNKEQPQTATVCLWNHLWSASPHHPRQQSSQGLSLPLQQSKLSFLWNQQNSLSWLCGKNATRFLAYRRATVLDMSHHTLPTIRARKLKIVH